MVLETLSSPIFAEKHPARMLFFGALYATVGLFLGLWIFQEHASLIMVFLTTMAAIPLVYNIIRLEERKDLNNLTEKNLLKEHSRALAVFMYYFIGATIAFSLLYTFLPADVTTIGFRAQASTITEIRGNMTGNAFAHWQYFTGILSNNLKVLIFCVLFSFLYGLGAIFILTWNASVIGVAIGQFIRSGLLEISGTLHWTTAYQYFQVFSIGLFKYSIHGIPEIVAYFVAGLAGGIISVAAIRHDFGTHQYEKVVMDSSVLLIISLVILVLSAFLEVYVTPVVFG